VNSIAIAAPSSDAVQAPGSVFGALRRQITEAGLLERRPGYYSIKIALTVAAYLAAWAGFIWLGNSWYQLLMAVVLGVTFTQVAFLGHDGGHRQVFARRTGNDALGYLLGNLLVGLSFGWWLDKHNRHHSHPNQEDHDPDLGDGGALIFTTRQAMARSTRVGNFLARKQAWFFFPMLSLEGIHLHIASFRRVLSARGRRHRGIELFLLTTHLIAYLGVLLLVLSPVKAVLFLAIQQGTFGFYMGSSFAPNHKGMPIIESDSDLDFLSRQVITSRNVRGGWFTDLLLGGLNYQIEHHLFPSMPRPNLRRAQPIVREYCARLTLPYAETSLIGSYLIVIRHLRDVTSPLRADTVLR